ncbi:MAG TPA: DUF2202 domain-containing protein [Kaistella sp.]|nr:DUF2202 domain-containing protein [Kaistella sp.]
MKNLLQKMSVLVLISIFSLFNFSCSQVRKTTNLDGQKLTKSEISALLYSLEEEKLAFEVYDLMYEKWGTIQFGNIRQSEEMHIAEVQKHLDHYKIPYQILEKGKYQNAELQKLYNQLVAQGNISELEALKVGATIEDVDIYDLEKLIKEVENPAIVQSFKFLECGSRNHMRAFNRGLLRYGFDYTPKYITKNQLQEILNSDHERCGMMR